MRDGKFSVDVIALQKIMLDNGIKTRLELSEKAGIDRNILSTVLSGSRLPSSRTMYALVGALNISPEDAGKIFFASNLLNR